MGIKLRGFKSRVQLSEEQLEHVERKPRRSVAPLLAAVVWFGSMAAAAAIHFAWSPWEGESDPVESEPAESTPVSEDVSIRPLRSEARGSRTVVSADAPSPETSAPTEAQAPAEAPEAPSARQAATSKPRDRTIRGSYAGARQNWLAGW